MQIRGYAVTVQPENHLYCLFPKGNFRAKVLRNKYLLTFLVEGFLLLHLLLLEKGGFLMQKIIGNIQKYKKIGIIGIFLVLAFLTGNTTGLTAHPHAGKVLSAQTHVIPSPTVTPASTTAPVTIINNIYVPTPATGIGVLPSVVPSPTSVPTPTQVPAIPTPTPSVMPTEAISTPIPTLMPTATPTPVAQTVTVAIDYAGAHAESTYTVTITSGETAWQVVKDAIGVANLHYTDYGGSLGIFITGINGIDAAANQYYDFQVNGTSASVGVSSYTVKDNDQIKFVLTSF